MLPHTRTAPAPRTDAPRPRRPAAGLALLAVGLIAGCHLDFDIDMANQPRYEALEASDFFDNGQAARLPVAGTIAQGRLRDDEPFSTGKSQGKDLEAFPASVRVTPELLSRGQERFRIYCTPCHGYDGEGKGMIVQRGFSPPPSFHEPRLRDEEPVGHFFQVITHGHGAMYSYANRVPPRDRWAIIAYIKALQLSRHATIEDVPPEERSKLRKAGPEAQKTEERRPR